MNIKHQIDLAEKALVRTPAWLRGYHPGPRMGHMSSHNKNGVVLRCVEFTHEVEKALTDAGIPCGKEY